MPWKVPRVRAGGEGLEVTTCTLLLRHVVPLCSAGESFQSKGLFWGVEKRARRVDVIKARESPPGGSRQGSRRRPRCGGRGDSAAGEPKREAWSQGRPAPEPSRMGVISFHIRFPAGEAARVGLKVPVSRRGRRSRSRTTVSGPGEGVRCRGDSSEQGFGPKCS